MTDKQEKSSDNEMTFFEHIDALRPHLVRGFSALFIIMIVAFVAKKFIIDMVLMGPQSPDFPTNRWLCELSHRLFGDDTLCINHIKLNIRPDRVQDHTWKDSGIQSGCRLHGG